MTISRWSFNQEVICSIGPTAPLLVAGDCADASSRQDPPLAQGSWSQPRPVPVQAKSAPSDKVDKLIGMSNGFLEQSIMSHFVTQPALTVPRSMRKARASRSDT
jgi:hypothetical protein